MFLAAIDPVLGIIVAAAISGFGAYLLAAKKMSGAIKTSDAEQLWTESRSIREWSGDRIAELTGVIAALETRVNAVEERNKTLLGENEALLDALGKCRAAVESLTQQLAVSEDRVEVLEEEAATEEKDRNER